MKANGIDIHKLLERNPFSTTGIPGELHFTLPFPSSSGKYTANYAGPNTSIDGFDGRAARCNPDLTPKEWSQPINEVDKACYHHHINYYHAKDDQTQKLEADNVLLSRLSQIIPNDNYEKIMKFIVEKMIKMKVNFGLGEDIIE